MSFFAQELGTAYTVSEKRIAKAQREALEQVKNRFRLPCESYLEGLCAFRKYRF